MSQVVLFFRAKFSKSDLEAHGKYRHWAGIARQSLDLPVLGFRIIYAEGLLFGSINLALQFFLR